MKKEKSESKGLLVQKNHVVHSIASIYFIHFLYYLLNQCPAGPTTTSAKPSTPAYIVITPSL